MPYKCEQELREKAESFIQSLTDAGVPVEPYPTMFRDYMVKLTIVGSGSINIYYSPKKAAFSLKLHELDDRDLAAEVEACWHGDSPEEQTQTTTVEYQAYVDGSYIDGFVGYGAVILHHHQEITRFSDAVTSDTDMRQVAGELAATMHVIDWCQHNDVSEIEIFYDYEGIEKWATGQWRANKPATQAYQAFMRATSVQVTWHKVKSHTGDQWNDVADDLAKQGALSQQDSPTPEDPLVELETTAVSFVAYLVENNIQASYDQIYNDQFARIVAQGGYFDLYNTQKRPMLPYPHNFKDTALQAEIERHWRVFLMGEADETSTPELTGFEEVEHYITILAPYRHYAFDFSALAQAIRPFVDRDTVLPTDDYDALERIYQHLRNDS